MSNLICTIGCHSTNQNHQQWDCSSDTHVCGGKTHNIRSAQGILSLTANMYHLGLGKDIGRKVFQLTVLWNSIIQYQFLKSQDWSFYTRRISLNIILLSSKFHPIVKFLLSSLKNTWLTKLCFEQRLKKMLLNLTVSLC